MDDWSVRAGSAGPIGFTNPDYLLELSRVHLAHAQRAAEHAAQWAGAHAQLSATPGMSGEGLDELRSFPATMSKFLETHSDWHARLSMAVAGCWANLTNAGAAVEQGFASAPTAIRRGLE